MKNFVYLLDSKDIFKKGDWFYLDNHGVPLILKFQEVINCKLGIKVKKLDRTLMGKISCIKLNILYFKEWINTE